MLCSNLSGKDLSLGTTNLDELSLRVVVHQVDALALLAVIQTLLGDVQRVLSLRQALFEDTLGLGVEERDMRKKERERDRQTDRKREV